LIHDNIENPKTRTDPVWIKMLIAAFNNSDVNLLSVFGYGTIGNWTQLDKGYLLGEDSSAEEDTVKFQSAHYWELQQLKLDDQRLDFSTEAARTQVL